MVIPATFTPSLILESSKGIFTSFKPIILMILGVFIGFWIINLLINLFFGAKENLPVLPPVVPPKLRARFLRFLELEKLAGKPLSRGEARSVWARQVKDLRRHEREQLETDFLVERYEKFKNYVKSKK